MPNYGFNLAVSLGATTYAVVVSMPNTDYSPSVSLNWNSEWWISSKTTAGFTVNFANPAPASATISYTLDTSQTAVAAGGSTARNFLQLVTLFCQECGVPTTNLTTVVGQTGELKQMCDWLANAWIRIQSKHDTWKFMRSSASWAVVAAQQSYTPAQCGVTAGTFRKWKRETFRNYVTAIGTASEIDLSYLVYDDFRDLWLFSGNRSTTGRPVTFTVHPDNSIMLAPVPLTGYTITGDYFRHAARLAADADIPALPDGHDDMLLVYRAKMFYGGFWGAKEAYATGREEYRAAMRLLEGDQLEQPAMGGSLA
jgi:hypothetical protein